MIGLDNLPDSIRKAYLKAVENKCEECLLMDGAGRSDGTIVKLEVHRITPGYKGGTYCPRNCKVSCEVCHDLYDDFW